MSYIALYRKYRPITYKDVVGQEDVIRILKNQVSTNKVSHAYIFSGTRGTGKTTIAKIFARAVNCESPTEDGEPCGTCKSCKTILAGETTDIVEMDAASNNSVENIRSIRQEVMYATTELKYKVYIIDEAHMLSPSAFNALLKTLEEPPEGVIFILATTEEHKILPTILSRCIRFNFKKLTQEEITKKLVEVLSDINVKYEAEAIKYIASISDGALRDALSILERCIEDESITLTKDFVKKIVGDTDSELISSLIQNIVRYDVNEVENLLTNILQSGKDLRYLNTKLIQNFTELLIDVKKNNFESNIVIKEISDTRLIYIIKELSALDDTLRQGINNQILFKSKIITLCLENINNGNLSLEDEVNTLKLKLERLEKTIERCEVTSKELSENKPQKKQEIEEKAKTPNNKMDEIKVVSKKEVQSKANIKELMKYALDKDMLQLYSALSQASSFEEDNQIRVVFKNDFAYKVVQKQEELENLKLIVDEITNSDINLVIEKEGEKKEDASSNFEKAIENAGINFESLD